MNERNGTPAGLLAELALAGFPVTCIGELARRNYTGALPILLRWLPRVRDRATIWAIVSALAVPAARPYAAPALIDLFRHTADDPCGLKWAIGYALSVVADDSVFDEIVALAHEKQHGRARAMIVVALGAMRQPQTVGALVELLEDADEDIVAEALGALGALKAARARPYVAPFATHPAAPVRAAAQRALAALDRTAQRAHRRRDGAGDQAPRRVRAAAPLLVARRGASPRDQSSRV